jgi:hypothetical protein
MPGETSPTAWHPETGVVVVIDGEDGAVWRVERIMSDGAVRCFSYRDGRVRIVAAAVVHPCPDNARAG